MSHRKVMLDDQELAQQPEPARRRVRQPRRTQTDDIMARAWRDVESRFFNRMNQQIYNAGNFTDGSRVESGVQTHDSDPSNPGPVSPPTEPESCPPVTRASVATESNVATRSHENDVAVADRTFSDMNSSYWQYYTVNNILLMDLSTPGSEATITERLLLDLGREELLRLRAWCRDRGLIQEYANYQCDMSIRLRRPA